ncbi:hypothetical protein B0H13DRAFT_2386838 [Mycena leptocephala]|nr:hypothetical protein B0H13DRAFT_2386838 [Mycena leptocephala]
MTAPYPETRATGVPESMGSAPAPAPAPLKLKRHEPEPRRHACLVYLAYTTATRWRHHATLPDARGADNHLEWPRAAPQWCMRLELDDTTQTRTPSPVRPRTPHLSPAASTKKKTEKDRQRTFHAVPPPRPGRPSSLTSYSARSCLVSPAFAPSLHPSSSIHSLQSVPERTRCLLHQFVYSQSRSRSRSPSS